MNDTAIFALWSLVLVGFVAVVFGASWLDERRARRDYLQKQQDDVELQVAKFREELDALPTTNPRRPAQ